jgi:hypothetical protein
LSSEKNKQRLWTVARTKKLPSRKHFISCLAASISSTCFAGIFTPENMTLEQYMRCLALHSHDDDEGVVNGRKRMLTDMSNMDRYVLIVSMHIEWRLPFMLAP